MEIACGATNTKQLESALLKADFQPDNNRTWRWSAPGPKRRTVIKFELLADLDEVRAGDTIKFEGCENLGAANLRGTSFAIESSITRTLSADLDGSKLTVELQTTNLAGFLLAKCAAAYSRRKSKDWYDIAYVLLNNDSGGPENAADEVLRNFHGKLTTIKSAIKDLRANFADPSAQGAEAYAAQMCELYPDLDLSTQAADAVLAVRLFCQKVIDDGGSK